MAGVKGKTGVYKRTKPTWNKGKKGLQVAWNKGLKLSKESIKKRDETRRKNGNYKMGEKNNFWKGGIMSENMKIRSSLEMKLWKKACLERDSFTCQKTGERGGKLVVHHINNFADFKELRTSIENGITLSKEAHKEFHKKYGIKNNSKEQLEEFLTNKQKVGK